MNFLDTIAKPQYKEIDECRVNVSLLQYTYRCLQDLAEEQWVNSDHDWRIVQEDGLIWKYFIKDLKKWDGYYDRTHLVNYSYKTLLVSNDKFITENQLKNYYSDDKVDVIYPEIEYVEKDGLGESQEMSKEHLAVFYESILVDDFNDCLRLMNRLGNISTRGINSFFSAGKIKINTSADSKFEMSKEVDEIRIDYFNTTYLVFSNLYPKAFFKPRTNQDILQEISDNISKLELNVNNYLDN